MQNIIETDRLSVSYGSQKVLDNISYGFKKNKITAILGSSGCGDNAIMMIVQ
jgi:spermidine/putrescine ABC transporter, ATP-binding protein PotA